MSERPIIENAYDLAGEVAQTILGHCYGTSEGDSVVGDVLLFGSAVRRQPAHDIDMVVIHDHPPPFRDGVCYRL